MSPAGFFDCPTEIRDEILSYLPSSNPPTLQGLQLGLTCKTLYEILRPVIVKIQVERLLGATTASNLRIRRLSRPLTSHSRAAPEGYHDSNWLPIASRRKRACRDGRDVIYSLFHPSENPDSEPEYDFSITYQPLVHKDSRLDAIEEMWCLHSLLSRSQRFRRIRFHFSNQRYREDEREAAEWYRTFLKLVEVCAEQPGMEITVTDGDSSRIWVVGTYIKPFFAQEEAHPESSTFLSSISSSLQRFRKERPPREDATSKFHWQPILQPIDFTFPAEAFTKSRLSLLNLSGAGAFSPLRYPFFHNLALQSSSSLTKLHLYYCPLLPGDWRAMLCCWEFAQLAHFSIRESSQVPFGALSSFLRRHPTLTDVSLLVHELDDAGSVEGLIDKKFLPNVRQIVASPALLIMLLSSAPSSSSGSTLFRKKSDLEILPALEDLTISQESDYIRGSYVALKFRDISKVLSQIAATRHCKTVTTLPKLHKLAIRTVWQGRRDFEGWLRGVSGTTDQSTSSFSSFSSSAPPFSAYASYNYPISNLPLRGISKFHISYSAPHYDMGIQSCSVPSMEVDPSLVVDFVIRLFGHGGSTGAEKLALSETFTSRSNCRIHTVSGNVVSREGETFPAAIEQIWKRCGDLDEVRLLGLRGSNDLDPDVEEVWRRPPGTPGN